MAALREAGTQLLGKLAAGLSVETDRAAVRRPVTAQDDPPKARPARDYVAVVVATRPYSVLELMSSLVRHQFSAVERGRTDSLAFVQHLKPELIVAVVDPMNPDDLGTIRMLGRSSDAKILVIAPSRNATALALRSGADIVVEERSGMDVLDAQLSALRRRFDLERSPDMGDDIVEAGPIRMDKAARQAFVLDRRLELTNMEFSLLLLLAEEQGHVISPLQAARRTSGRLATEAEANQTIKVYVRRLRQKLSEAGCNPTIIANVRGRGYMLDPMAGSRDSQGAVSG